MERRHLLVACAAAAFAPSTRSQESPAWTALQQGGVALLLRHAETAPGVGDPPGFRLGDCSTQRNLSETGREHARRIGAAFKARGVPIGTVLTSEWCRCVDTAHLAFPDASMEPYAALNSFFDDRSRESEQTRRVRARISAANKPENLVCVTHHVNIVALTGVGVAAGEAVVLQPGNGSLIGRIRI